MSTPEASINKLNYIIANYDDDLAAKADKEGSYPNLVAGNLYSTSGKTDVTPYLFRETNADRLDLKAVTGGTVAWNQQMPLTSGAVSPNSGTRTFDSASGVYTIVCTSLTTNSFGYWITGASFKAKANHKTLVLCKWKPSVQLGNVRFGTDTQNRVFNNLPANAYTELATIVAPTADAVITNYSNLTNLGLSALTVDIKDIMCIDLTQLFGSTIADYIYTLEQNNAGAGVAWFKKLFPKPYYAYDAGSLQSVNASAHRTVGFNQSSSFSNSTSSTQYNNALYAEADLQPSTTYCISFVGAVGHKIYRNENLFTNAKSVITADGTRQYIVLTTVSEISKSTASQYESGRGWRIFKNEYGNTVTPNFSDVCINLSKPTGTPKNGDYVPYEAHTYALDSSLTLRGIPKLDANNNLYYDGDTYESDGKVTRKYKYINSFSRGATDSTGKLYAIATLTENGSSETADSHAVCNLLPAVGLTPCRNNADNGIKSIAVYRFRKQTPDCDTRHYPCKI